MHLSQSFYLENIICRCTLWVPSGRIRPFRIYKNIMARKYMIKWQNSHLKVFNIEVRVYRNYSNWKFEKKVIFYRFYNEYLFPSPARVSAMAVAEKWTGVYALLAYTCTLKSLYLSTNSENTRSQGHTGRKTMSIQWL